MQALTNTHQVQAALGAMQPGGVALLYFTATWCGPCKRIKPFVQQLMEQNAPRLQVWSLDVDKAEQPLLQHFQVSSVPTFIFVRENQVVGVVKGGDQAALQAKCDQVMSC